MTRRRLSRLGLALLALGAGLLVLPMHAGAATATKVGWWYRTSDPRSAIPRSASSPVIPDLGGEAVAPPVADGSLLVEGTPEGATAIAAITYVLDDRESHPVLTIAPSEDSLTPADILILACRAAVDWSAPGDNPGRWQDKPLVDCGRSVNGIVNEDGTITFALQLLVSGPELDVVLVPGVVGETPRGKVGSTFSLSFSSTDGARLATTSAPIAAATPSPEASPPSRASSVGPSFVAPVTPVVEPALEPQEQAPTVPDRPLSAAGPVAKDDDTRRGVALGILLAGAALAAVTRVAPARAEDDTIGLGRFRRTVPAAWATGEPVHGGLGRFARPRTSAPSALS